MSNTYFVTVVFSDAATARTVAHWLNKPQLDLQSNNKAVVQGVLTSDAHNCTFVLALGKHLGQVRLLMISPVPKVGG